MPRPQLVQSHKLCMNLWFEQQVNEKEMGKNEMKTIESDNKLNMK